MAGQSQRAVLSPSAPPSPEREGERGRERGREGEREGESILMTQQSSRERGNMSVCLHTLSVPNILAEGTGNNSRGTPN